jgi:hypothetical protein
MKTKNLDEGVASKSLFAGAASHRHHPFSKTTRFADISKGIESFSPALARLAASKHSKDGSG